MLPYAEALRMILCAWQGQKWLSQKVIYKGEVSGYADILRIA